MLNHAPQKPLKRKTCKEKFKGVSRNERKKTHEVAVVPLKGSLLIFIVMINLKIVMN